VSAPSDPPYWRDRPPPTDLERLGAERYLSLTTVQRDGVPVSTPVRVVRDGDRLLVRTGADTGEVERIRQAGRVTVTPCDFRGQPKRGRPLDLADPVANAALATPIEVTARLLPDADEPRLRILLAEKYRLSFRVTSAVETVLRLVGRRPPDRKVAVELRLTGPAA